MKIQLHKLPEVSRGLIEYSKTLPGVKKITTKKIKSKDDIQYKTLSLYGDMNQSEIQYLLQEKYTEIALQYRNKHGEKEIKELEKGLRDIKLKNKVLQEFKNDFK